MGEKYQGFNSYETFVVSLWVDNDQHSYNYWREAAEEAYRDAEYDRLYASQSQLDRAKCILADRLKEEHEEALPELEGFAADLLNAAFSEVDWYEIAENILESAIEEYEQLNVKEG